MKFLKAPLAILSLTFLAGPAFADPVALPPPPPEKHPIEAKVEKLWDRIDDDATDVVDDFVKMTRDVSHDRPELQAIPHLVLLRKGNNVKLAYCRSPLGQLFRNRKDHPTANRCDEVLTKGSFNINTLEACATRRSKEGEAASNLERELARTIRRKETYPTNYFGIHASRAEYKELFKECAADARKTAKPKVRHVAATLAPLAPAPDLEPKALPEFHPVDHSAEDLPPAAVVNGTLGQ